jgi:hypothetical protein
MAPTPSPPQPSLTPEQLLALALSGKIDVTIDTGTTKYILTASVPTSANAPYAFKLTEQPQTGDPSDLADFSFVSSDDFSVKVRIPAFTAGTATISGGFELGSTPPPPA